MRRKYTNLPYTEYPVLAFGNESNRLPIDMIILHSTNGTYQSAISWFNNPNAGTSAHYIISNNGDLAAMLEEYFVGFHSGNYLVNQKSIAIEHEGYVGMVRGDKEYEMSIKLVADICKFYNIPVDNIHIKPHRDIVATACPTDLDVGRIINGAKALVSPPPSTNPCQSYIDGISFRDKVIGERDAEIVELKKQLANIPPCPSPTDCSAYINQIQHVKDIIWSKKGWWWTRINNLRAMFPK